MIDHERGDILNKLADATGKIDIGRRCFLTALNLLCGPQRFFTNTGASLRRRCTKVIFERLYLDDADGVTGHVLKDRRTELVEAGQTASRRYQRPAPRDGLAWDTNRISPTLTGEAGNGSTEAGLHDPFGPGF